MQRPKNLGSRIALLLRNFLVSPEFFFAYNRKTCLTVRFFQIISHFSDGVKTVWIFPIFWTVSQLSEIIVELLQLSLDQLKSGILYIHSRMCWSKSNQKYKENVRRRRIEKWQKWQIDKWQRIYLRVPVAAAILNQQDSVPVIFKYQTFVAGSPLLKGQQLFGNSSFKSFGKSHPRLKADISVLRTHALKKIH